MQLFWTLYIVTFMGPLNVQKKNTFSDLHHNNRPHLIPSQI